jgi:hypothetical protein
MNPDTNRFETLPAEQSVPNGWIEFAIGEEVTVKNYRFKIIRVSPNRLHLEPLGGMCQASNAKTKHHDEG